MTFKSSTYAVETNKLHYILFRSLNLNLVNIRQMIKLLDEYLPK